MLCTLLSIFHIFYNPLDHIHCGYDINQKLNFNQILLVFNVFFLLIFDYKPSNKSIGFKQCMWFFRFW